MLYANTDDGSSALWVCDENGVVVDNISYSIGVRAPILEQINEHYGTSFTGWSDNEIGLRIGDTLPNWNAYEKIMLPPIIYAKITPLGSSLWTIGKILGNTFKILCQNNEGAWQVTNDGKINDVFGHPYDLMSYMWAPKLQQAGYEISAFEIEVVDYNVGDTIENWNDFIDIS